MEPIRKKLSSLLIKTANKEMKALDPQSQCAEELAEIENVDAIIAEEIEKICKVATLGEITRILLLAARLKKASGQKREAIKSQLKKIAEEVLKRAESQVGPLTLPKTYRHLLLEL